MTPNPTPPETPPEGPGTATSMLGLLLPILGVVFLFLTLAALSEGGLF